MNKEDFIKQVQYYLTPPIISKKNEVIRPSRFKSGSILTRGSGWFNYNNIPNDINDFRVLFKQEEAKKKNNPSYQENRNSR